MIVTELYTGQGLGNQIWVYVVLRSLAQKYGYDFGVQRPDRFKGHDIFEIDFGKVVVGGTGKEGGPPITLPETINYYVKERQLFEKSTSLDVTLSDFSLLNISDHTKIDGNCQSLEYINEIDYLLPVWLKLKPFVSSDLDIYKHVCVIHVRGGDFLNTYSFLPRKYYVNAMYHVKKENPKVSFVIVTDDLIYCKKILPGIPVIGSTPINKIDNHRAQHHSGGTVAEDFFILNKAKYIILSSSTFSFWAVYLNTNKPYVVAPKYWFAFSKSNGWWSTPNCIVQSWMYLDKYGKIFSGNQCLVEAKPALSSAVAKVNMVNSLVFRLERKIAKMLMR